VYGFIDRQNLPGMFRTFDFPNPDASSSQRFATTVPQQALFMMNSPFAQEQARRLMRRTEIQAATAEPDRVRALYQLLYQRSPEREELKLAQEFLRRPVTAPSAVPLIAAGWRYGYGAFDASSQRVRGFVELKVREGDRLSPEKTFPDETFGYLSLTAIGGHPGPKPETAGIRRWMAAAGGKVRIEGTLAHASTSGDGVRGRIVSSERGVLGEWTVRDRKMATKVEDVNVAAGETLDFVVDPLTNDNSDNFTWSPTITFTGEGDTPSRTWNAKRDFDVPPKVIEPLTRWEEFAQVLLLSNELAFVD
jgi:hypothetical protein